MKNLKSIMLGLALIICGAAKAGTAPDGDNLTTRHGINTYIDAMTRGKLDGFKEVLDPSVKFTMLRGKKLLSNDKKEMLDFMKTNQNVEQSCVTRTSIVESNADITVIKIDMNYEGFIRSNYVTITNTGTGWKITSVHSVFK